MDILLACVLVLAGLIFGSFLNVCISRIPRDESIVHPGSHCPQCGRPIRWRHNLPVFSYVLLRGRCADCGQRISPRYPAVELLTAILFVACFAQFGFSWVLLKFCIFCFLVVGLIFMDAETGLLPHEFTYPGIFTGLVAAWFVPVDGSGTVFLLRLMNWGRNLTAPQLSLLDSLLAAVVGAGFFYLIWALYYLVRKRHGIGFGDIALIAMCGTFLGLKLTLFVLFSAPILGSIFAVVLLLRGTFSRDSEPTEGQPAKLSTRDMFVGGQIRFGVFLGGCSVLAIFWGELTWRQYLAWIAST